MPRELTCNVSPIASFSDRQDDWATLNRSAGGSLLLDPLFMSRVLDCFCDGEERVAVVSRDGAPVAMGIFVRDGRFGWRTFQSMNAPLGAWVMDPSVDLRAAIVAVSRALPGLPALVSLTQQDPILQPRPVEHGSMKTLDYIETAAVDITEPFESYWNARGKNLRHTMKRQRNLLSRNSIEPRLEILDKPQDMDAAVADYGRIELASWKGHIGSAVSPDNLQGRFYSQMLADHAAQGKGLVLRYWYNDDLVATDLCIHDDSTIIILKTTYVLQDDKTSPAQLMRQDAFEVFFDTMKLKRIEFYGRTMDWHRKLTDNVRTMYHVNWYRHGLLAKVHEMARAS